jgi:hypothetical protein
MHDMQHTSKPPSVSSSAAFCSTTQPKFRLRVPLPIVAVAPKKTKQLASKAVEESAR